MAPPKKPKKIGDFTLLNNQGSLILTFGDISVDPTDIGTGKGTVWGQLHTDLKEILGIGEDTYAIDHQDEFLRNEYVARREAEAKAQIQWTPDQTQRYINELYYRIVQDPRFIQAADMQNSTEKDQWDEAIIIAIHSKLTAPKSATYDYYGAGEDQTLAGSIMSDILSEEYNFILRQGSQNPNVLFKETRTNTTLREMKDQGWITQELYDTTINLKKLKNKPTEDLTDLELEALALGENLNYTDSERLKKITEDDTIQSFEKWNQSTLRAITEDDKLNGTGIARLFPISDQARSRENQALRLEKDFNLWNEDTDLNKAIDRVAGKYFRSDNNITQAIKNNLKNTIATKLEDYRNGLRRTDATPNEIAEKTFLKFDNMLTRQRGGDPFASYGVSEYQPSEFEELQKAEHLKYAKNNPTSYSTYRLNINGLLPEDIPAEVRTEWNRSFSEMKTFDELDNQFNPNYLNNLILQAKNEKIAANTDALKSLALSSFGVSTTTPQNIVDEITGTNKAVDQLAQLMSSYYTSNPFTTESQEEVLSNFMKVYALTPSGTIAQKQSWQDGAYSFVPGTKITIGGQTISDPDNPESVPTTYFDANVQAAQKAIDEINQDDPFAQMKAGLDESKPPAAPSFFKGMPSFVERAPEPFGDEELLRDLQAAYGDSPEFLQFIAPQLQRIRDEYTVTQRPGEEITAKMVDFGAKDFFMGQFEAQRPKTLKDFINKNIDKYRTEFRTQTPALYEQETSRIQEEQDFENLQKEREQERERRTQLISKPVTIFRRRSR